MKCPRSVIEIFTCFFLVSSTLRQDHWNTIEVSGYTCHTWNILRQKYYQVSMNDIRVDDVEQGYHNFSLIS